MVNMNIKSGVLVIIWISFSLVSHGQNVTEESVLYELTSDESIQYQKDETINNDQTKGRKEETKEVLSSDTEDSSKRLEQSNETYKLNKPSPLHRKSELKIYERGRESFQNSFHPQNGNLPMYAKRLELQDREFHDPAIETSQSPQFSFFELKRGTVLSAVIDGDIVAYPDSQAPVSATVTFPEKYKRSKLLGTASLDLVTKRVNVEFTTLILPKEATPYSIKGITSDRSGKLGLEGVHKTDYWNWLWAEVLVRSSGGLVEASSEKDHSIFGSSTTVSPTNAAKKGVATGLNTIADRSSERRLKAVDITEVSGPTAVQISITQ